jgi:uncharacterized protein YjbI with pentapeptide repeats
MDPSAASPIRPDGNGAGQRNQWIALQFDDRVFVLSRQSLTGEPGSLFCNLFDDGSVSEASLDRNHTHALKPVVFDRSPRYVEPVLQYLRTGELLVADKSDTEYIRGVYLEAEYFSVNGLLDIIATMYPDATRSVAQRKDEHEEELRANPPRKPNTAERIEIERMLMNAPAVWDGRGPRLRWRGMRFNGVDFSELYLAGIDFTACELNDCRFVNCDMSGANLTDAELERSDFTRATLKGAICARALATKANFTLSDCTNGDFRYSVFVEADFTQATLSGCVFESSDMTSCVLAGADLRNAKLNKALLHNVERQGTSLSMGGVIM